MNDFKAIKSKWAERDIPLPPTNGYQEVIRSAKYIKNKQRIGQLILALTILCLLAFFFHVSAFKNARLTSGLLLMMGSLLLRIGIEFLSNAKLKGFTPSLAVEKFSQRLSTYYKGRLFIHTVLTPLLFITYIMGFLVLLPSFKANLSAGFYNYILISGTLSFIFLAILIAVQTRKELKTIKQMKTDMDNT